MNPQQREAVPSLSANPRSTRSKPSNLISRNGSNPRRSLSLYRSPSTQTTRQPTNWLMLSLSTSPREASEHTARSANQRNGTESTENTNNLLHVELESQTSFTRTATKGDGEKKIM